MAVATRTRTTPAEIPVWLEDDRHRRASRQRRPRPLRPVKPIGQAPARPAPVARPNSRVYGWVAAIAWVELATALQLVRSGGLPPWRSVWAEDAGFFLPEALHDPIGTLFRTHAGYFQFICRAVGSVASLFPVESASVVFAVGGALVASLLSVYVYRTSDCVLEHKWARALMAALMLLTPAAVFEVSNSGVDLHWYFLFAGFWALWSVAQTRGRLITDAVVVAVAAMSSPLTIFLAPLALRRFILGSGWKRWIVPGTFAIGVAAQGIYRLTHAAESKITAVNVNDVPPWFGLRVVASTLVGDGFLKDTWSALGWTLVFLTVGITVVVVGYGLAIGRGRRLFIIASAGYAVILTVAALLLRGTGDHIAPGRFTLGGSRYAFVPILLLTAAFIAVADTPGGRRWLRVLPAVLVFGVAVANAVSPLSLRPDAPDWPKAVAAAAKTCRTPDQIVGLPGVPIGWQSFVECRDLIKQ